MKSDEIRSAAERLERIKAGEDIFEIYLHLQKPFTGPAIDRCDLADAYLAHLREVADGWREIAKQLRSQSAKEREMAATCGVLSSEGYFMGRADAFMEAAEFVIEALQPLPEGGGA